MKIYSHNVRVWTRDRDKTSEWFWRIRMQKIQDLIKQENPDILCLQELSFPANLYIPKNYHRIGFTASHPIYVKKGLKTRHHRFHLRFDSVDVKINNEWIGIINVHLHWNKKIFTRNMKRIDKIVSRKKQAIVCGDFNKTSWEVTLASNLKVINTPELTFHNPSNNTVGTIDHFAVTPNLSSKVKSVTVLQDKILSDHQPIILCV